MKPAEIQSLKDQALAECATATSVQDLEAVRIRYLSRKGAVAGLMKGLGSLDASDRAEAGRLANEFKKDLAARLASRQEELTGPQGGSVHPPFDCTLPGTWRGLGSMHPISRVIEDATRIFGKLGFSVAYGPDVETKYHNFDALNTPDHHPSLDSQDTFWLDTGELLRTQTSPVQIRAMESCRPPVRIITPGRCYRRDTTDATHTASFHQIEGLYVDRDVSLADLKGTIAYFAHQMMGPDVGVRLRPHFFPFTEPSVECDFSCHVCGGTGCRVCKHSGWIEIAGAGMVDPRVFEKVGYDPEEFTGFAFGMGVERIAAVKYGITDIRLLYENDAAFLSQIA